MIRQIGEPLQSPSSRFLRFLWKLVGCLAAIMVAKFILQIIIGHRL